MFLKNIDIDDQRKIIMVDDLFTFSEISGIYASAINHKYSIYNSSEAEVQNLTNKRLGCPLEQNDYILENIFSGDRLDLLKDLSPQDTYNHWRSYLNLGIHSDTHLIHVDEFSKSKGITLLYYVNRNWSSDWGGETLFYDDQRKEIIHCCSFVPGRIVIFDSSIPHSAKSQNHDAPPFRITLASKFIQEKQK
jgi:hypothetical protein